MKKEIFKNKYNKRIRNFLFRGIFQGAGIALGFFSTTIIAVAVTGTIKTWTTGEALTAADLNTTVASLRTAIEGIPDWTKSGSNAVYTAGIVGIGTSPYSPASLTLGASNGTALALIANATIAGTNSSGNLESFLFPRFNDASYLNYGTNGFYIRNNLSTNIMYMANSGNVGIGNSSPTELLQIGDLTNNSGSRRALSFGSSGFGEPAADNVNSDGDKIIFWNSSSGFASDYRIGIGSYNNLWFKTHSGGKYEWYSSNVTKMVLDTSTGNLSITGSLAQNSDLRKKKNISNIKDSINILSNLKPVKFNWRSEESSDTREQYGLIAQEVEKILPSLVNSDKNGFKSVNYISIIPFLVESIQTLIKDNKIILSKLESISNLPSQYISMLEENAKLKSENKKIQEQLSELKKENRQQSISFEERFKALEDLRYAKK